MDEIALATARAVSGRVLADPTPADLWELQKALLVVGGEPAARARTVVHAFHACLRALESKSASRSASRWGAALGIGAVASIGASDAGDSREDALERLLASGVPAMFEIGAALKSAQAWEVEAVLVYDELAWFLYDELWDVSLASRPDLTPAERREQVELALDPLLDTAVPDGVRAGIVVDTFLAVLAARLAWLF